MKLVYALWILTLSKSLALGKAQVNLALLSLNRDIGGITHLYVYLLIIAGVRVNDAEDGGS